MCHQVVATPRARGLTATRPTTSARVRWRWRKATPAVNRPNPSPSLAKRVSVRPPVDQISMRSVCKHLVIKCHVEARSISADLTLKWFNGWQRCNIFSLWSIQSVIFLVGCQYWVWRQKDSGRGTRCSAELDWPDPVPRWGAQRRLHRGNETAVYSIRPDGTMVAFTAIPFRRPIESGEKEL